MERCLFYKALRHTNQIHADRKMPAGHMGSQTHKSKNARHRYRTNLQTDGQIDKKIRYVDCDVKE